MCVVMGSLKNHAVLLMVMNSVNNEGEGAVTNAKHSYPLPRKPVNCFKILSGPARGYDVAMEAVMFRNILKTDAQTNCI